MIHLSRAQAYVHVSIWYTNKVSTHDGFSRRIYQITNHSTFRFPIIKNTNMVVRALLKWSNSCDTTTDREQDYVATDLRKFEPFLCAA
jgi:hypothetical protein